MALINNPVLRGFNPDPSICRKGSDFYIATSTFEYFPMIPVYHSRNLSQWEYIGSCVTDPDSVINLRGCRSGKGIYAPCIRYNAHDNMFYVITTLVRNDSYKDNICFFVKAENPQGPWSEPVIVSQAEGIDPSLFFDDDGCAYIIGNMRPEPENQSNKHRYIWMDTIDTVTGKLGGRKTVVLKDGAVYNAVCPEGPRLMKKDGWYYILLAEGGTEHNHAQSVFRSRNPFGPYEINPRNPVLTHRMLGRGSEFNSIGHADLVDTEDGRWFASCLGVRPYENPFLRNIGRETFLVPVIWEEEWPVFAPETGKVEREYQSCIDEAVVSGSSDYPLFLRSDNHVRYSEKEGKAVLGFAENDITGDEDASFIGWRQREKDYSLTVSTEFIPSEREEAGLVIMLNSRCFFRLALRARNEETVIEIEDEREVLFHSSLRWKTIHLRAKCHGLKYSFSYSLDCKNWIQAGDTLPGEKLSMLEFGFTGVVFGIYALGKGTESTKTANFTSIHHE